MPKLAILIRKSMINWFHQLPTSIEHLHVFIYVLIDVMFLNIVNMRAFVNIFEEGNKYMDVV